MCVCVCVCECLSRVRGRRVCVGVSAGLCREGLCLCVNTGAVLSVCVSVSVYLCSYVGICVLVGKCVWKFVCALVDQGFGQDLEFSPGPLLWRSMLYCTTCSVLKPPFFAKP